MTDHEHAAPQGAEEQGAERATPAPAPAMQGAAAALGNGMLQRKLSRRWAEGVQLRSSAAGERAGDAGAAGESPQDVAGRGVATGGGELPHRDRIQESFGPEHDLGGVQAHVGGDAAAAAGQLGASAFATGNHVGFAEAPDLHTAAHEAAHVVQQRGGVQLKGGLGEEGDAHERHADAVADRVVRGESSRDLLGAYRGSGRAGGAGVQLRRVPANVESLLRDPAHPDQDGANAAAHLTGERLLVARAMSQLTAEERVKVEQRVAGGKKFLEYLFGTPPRELLIRTNAAIIAVRPDLKLGDPALIDAGARDKTPDAANIAKLVAGAKAIFDAVAGGARDKDLTDVFGAKNVAEAKARYAKGSTWMQNLHAANKIVSDRSGYYQEIGVGGLTKCQAQIALSPGLIDAPDKAESVITLLHESLHAGNAEVRDFGYIHQASFTVLAEDVKLNNAAHYEVAGRRILGAAHTFDGEVFVPAGTTVGGVKAPEMTDDEKAVRGASETLRKAWTMGLNMHNHFLAAYKDPAGWATKPAAGMTYKDGLPYWSKVEGLTVHLKTDIDPASKDPARQPVSQIDMALSEGLVRRLMLAMSWAPTTPTKAAELEQRDPGGAKAAKATVDGHRDFILKQVLQFQGVSPLTGSLDRDYRVVQALANMVWAEALKKRSPSDFAD